MSEFIVIQVGQCGNQIGSCLLPEILQEYNVTTPDSSKSKPELQQFMSSFFNYDKRTGFETLAELLHSGAKARILCIDMEDSVVARFKSGRYRGLYDKKCLITNYPGSGNNWAEGFCSHGPKYEGKILDAVRYNVEQCEHPPGFLLLFSVGGGTGSGLGTFILRLLKDHYPGLDRFVVCVYPIGTEDVITCPYNMAFATQELVNNATCVFPVENRCLLDMTTKRRYCKPIKNPSRSSVPYEDMNKIIVDMILHLTSGARFGGKPNIDITSMVPLPRLKFLSSGFSPVVLKLTTSSDFSKNELFIRATSSTNQLVKVDPLDSSSVLMGVALLGRGNYSVDDMGRYIQKLKNKFRFGGLSQLVKVGLCEVPPTGLDFSMFSLSNTTAMSGLFEDVLVQFRKLYRRKAHVHHYTAISEFDIHSFKECQSSLGDIVQLYQETEPQKRCIL